MSFNDSDRRWLVVKEFVVMSRCLKFVNFLVSVCSETRRHVSASVFKKQCNSGTR